MDPNLQVWRKQGQSFLERFRIWVDLLDPALLLSSDAEIKKAHDLLKGAQKPNEENGQTLTLSLSSAHADSGTAIPIIFRPPALFPISAPLVVGSVLPHRSVHTALFWQFMLQTYFAVFNCVNGNSLTKQGSKTSLKQLLPLAGTISFVSFAGAFPQVFINRLDIRSVPVQTFLRSVVPIPLSAALAFFSVIATRSEESEIGIKVFNSEGCLVGRSKAAGEKAVRETAWSRMTLLGTTTAVPNLIFLLLKRTRLAAALHPFSTALVLGLMIPTSFSLFPQLGMITKENVEEELKDAAVDGQLYYHRGL